MDKEENHHLMLNKLPLYRYGILGTSLLYNKHLSAAYFSHPPSTGPRAYPVGFVYGNLLAAFPLLMGSFTGPISYGDRRQSLESEPEDNEVVEDHIPSSPTLSYYSDSSEEQNEEPLVEPDDTPTKIGDNLEDNDRTSMLSDEIIVPNYLVSRDNTASEERSSEEQHPSITDDWIIIDDET